MLNMKNRKQKQPKRGRSRKGRSSGYPPTTSFKPKSLIGTTYDNRVSSYVRSGYSDLNITASSSQTIGMVFASTGYYTNTAFQTWTSGSTDLPASFDFYRIDRIQVSFIFNSNFSSVANYAQTLPYLFYCVDYNDGAVTGIGDITQRSTCECARMDDVIAVNFTPRAQMTAYSTTISSGYAESPLMTWFSTSNTVSHYGLKFAVDATQMTSTSTTVGNLRLFVKCFFSCKEPK
jgi:hypothetical protein